MTWATTGETLTYTGIEVTTAEINQAQFIVELFADVTEDAAISTKNLRLLKMAVAYQAAYITDTPDLFTHVDVTTMLQDGLQFTRFGANGTILAPLAKRAIDRLSWRRNTNLRIRRPRRNTTRGGVQQYQWGTSVNGFVVSEGNAFESGFDGGTWEGE